MPQSLRKKIKSLLFLLSHLFSDYFLLKTNYTCCDRIPKTSNVELRSMHTKKRIFEFQQIKASEKLFQF